MKILITLSSSTNTANWEEKVRKLKNFDRIVLTKSGIYQALDKDDSIIDIFVPDKKQLKRYKTDKNMNEAKPLVGTPDGELAIIEQNPTYITVQGETNPLVATPVIR